MSAEPVIYPDTYGGWPLCCACFQPQQDISHALDPRTGTLSLLCGLCYRTLDAGQEVPLPAGEVLEQTWLRLARLHQNSEIGDETVDFALAALTSQWMPPQTGWQRFTDLKDALLQLQAAEDPSAVLDCAMTGPDHDPETYTNDMRGLVVEAVHKLIGRPA